VRSAECGFRSKKLPATIIVLSLCAAIAFAGQDQHIAQKLAGLESTRGTFSFVVLGDNRSDEETYRSLVMMAMERKPSFVVNTGDQIATPGDQDQWAAFWELSKPVMVPYFLTVGNHDVNSVESETVYKDQVDLPGNELYYSFRAGRALFIVLNSHLTGEQQKITGDQFAWLQSHLEQAGKGPVFVFLHHPLYPVKGTGRHYGNSLDRYPEDRDRLHALLKKHGVTAVFAGHEHLYLRRTVDRVSHIITGGGGAPLYADDRSGGFHHYVLVTVGPKKITVEVVDSNGNVRDRYAL